MIAATREECILIWSPTIPPARVSNVGKEHDDKTRRDLPPHLGFCGRCALSRFRRGEHKSLSVEAFGHAMRYRWPPERVEVQRDPSSKRPHVHA